MEWREIEVFLTPADEPHFGRTVERLHLSQARVSQTEVLADDAVDLSPGLSPRYGKGR